MNYLGAIPLLSLHLSVNELVRRLHAVRDRFVVARDDVV